MANNIELLGHASIKIDKIYFDPFQLNQQYNDADYIFITHSHYDHYSEEDILKVKNDDTRIIVTKDLYDKARGLFDEDKVIIIESDKKYSIGKVNFETVPAYNPNKKFHPKENEWVGYVLEYNNVRYYIAGDTDITEENKKIACDVAFIPVGGTYTMDYKEAAELINIIKPKVAIPIHYGSIVGTKEDAINFENLIDKKIECEIQL